MKNRAFAWILTLILLFGCANAEFYTANEDVYYHAKAGCIAGSTFEISEHAAVQFEKLACPVCVDRVSVGGEMIEFDLPNGYADVKGWDFKDGKLLLCGTVNWPKEGRPWIAMYDLQGNKLQEVLGKPAMSIVRDAKFLSDGKIAIIRSTGVGSDEYVELYKDGKMVHRSAGMNLLRRIWPLEDGFLIYGSEKMYQYRLAKCDNDGNIVWTMDMTERFPLSDQQPGLTDILVGEKAFIAYGKKDPKDMGSRPVIVVFDDDGNIVGQHQVEKIVGQHTKTLYDENMQPVGYEILDSYMGSYKAGAWTQNGLLMAGANSVTCYDARGESWFCDLADCLWDENGCLMLDGKRVERGSVADMIAWNGGCLLAITVDVYTPMLGSGDEPAGKGYVRLVEISPEGKIVRDWFEETADIAFNEEIRLLWHGDTLYLFVQGGTMIPMKDYEEGYPSTKIPRKAILKKISA